MILLRIVFSLSALPLLFSSPVKADEVYTFVVKKQAEKAKTRWSLGEWLATKEKMRLMDMWLALHSPSPYEFFLGYDYLIFQTMPAGAQTAGHRLSAAAYASIFGLEGRYETQPYGDWMALFKLRFFGYHVQSTHISLEAGARSRTDGFGSYRNPVVGLESAIYLAKFFGITGNYQWYLGSTPRSNGSSATGSRWDAGAFIDFSFFRVGASYFNESSSDNQNLMAGYALGAKLFF